MSSDRYLAALIVLITGLNVTAWLLVYVTLLEIKDALHGWQLGG